MTEGQRSETVQRGKAIYEERIRALVEKEHCGKIIAVDVESGDYEIAADNADEVAALRRLRTRHIDAMFFRIRIGCRAVGKIGGSWRMLLEGEGA